MLNKNLFTLVSLVSILPMATACATDTSTESTEDSPSVESASLAPAAGDRRVEDEVVATVDVGYGKVRFHVGQTTDGAPVAFVSEEAPNNVRSTPLDAVMAEGHTTLEVFQALLPNEEVPLAIADTHASEAARLARPNADVIAATFDKDAPVEKSIAACQAFVWADPPDTTCYVNTLGNLRQAHYVSGQNVGLHVGQFWSYATTANVALGICNESSGTIYGRIGVDPGCDSSSAYNYWGWATLSAGTMWRWWNFSSTNSCAPAGCTGLCLSLPTPSRYRVDGWSTGGRQYHLKTGEVKSSLKQACVPR